MRLDLNTPSRIGAEQTGCTERRDRVAVDNPISLARRR